MSNILILHGPSQYEVRKSYELSQFLAANTRHQYSVAAEVRRSHDTLYLNIFDFIENPLGEAILNESSAGSNLGETISLGKFLCALTNGFRKVIILPSPKIISSQGFVLALGYILGKNKLAGSLLYKNVDLPDWYHNYPGNGIQNKEDLLSLIQNTK